MDADRAARLIDSGMALTSELSLGAILKRIVQLGVEVTGARYGALGVLDETGGIEEFITEGMPPEQRSAIGDPPTGGGVLGVLISEGLALRLPEISSHPRSVGFPPNHPPMHSFLGAPVTVRGKTFGRIYLTEKSGAAEFDLDDEKAIVVLASQAAVAIENAYLLEETRRQAAEIKRLSLLEDRERIAKELHDGVIQSLFAVGMGLQGTVALVEDDQIAARLDAAVEEIDNAIRDLRNYIFGLRPGILADRQLHQALRDLGDEFAAKTDVVTVVTVDGGVASELAPLAADLVQITREALSNVGKHAHATTCRVSLQRDRHGSAELVVDDDGIGFDPHDVPEGMGLRNLSERVEALGGKLAIESSSGEGTTILATIPM